MSFIKMSDLMVENIRKITDQERIAIYGTGKGAKEVIDYIVNIGLSSKIKAIIDNDNVCDEQKNFCGYKISKLSEIVGEIDVIVIAAINNSNIIEKRIIHYFEESAIENICVISAFSKKNTCQDKIEFIEFIEKSVLRNNKETFVEKREQAIKLHHNDPKFIAWYLPQFHRIDINDKYYGRGFTEWTNSSQSIPLFKDHYQPRIPYDVGYYDLSVPETLERQIELAKYYGLYGFSFYYYWFSGKRIMEKPLEYYLNHKELDFPFCITWANENWSALWDGGKKDLIFEQKHKEEDDESFIEDLLPYFHDDRYIRIDNKPLIIVYRPNIWDENRLKSMTRNFRVTAQKNGISDLYIMFVNYGGNDEDVELVGADAVVEFPPQGVVKFCDRVYPAGYKNPYSKEKIWDMTRFFKEQGYLVSHVAKNYYRGVMTMWDNSPRRAKNGCEIYMGNTPMALKKWLVDVIEEGKKIHENDRNFIFINAWNEWAEGTYLEPDMKYGYAFLNAVSEAIETTRNNG